MREHAEPFCKINSFYRFRTYNSPHNLCQHRIFLVPVFLFSLCPILDFQIFYAGKLAGIISNKNQFF